MKKISLFFAALFCVASVSARTIYLDLNGNNLFSDGAFVALYSWGGEADAWTTFTLVEGETSIYSTEVPDGRTGMKIVRFEAGVTTPSWEAKKWNESGDITIPADNNMFVVTSWINGTWSNYGEEIVTEYYLVGTFDGVNTWDKQEKYLFSGEPLKLTTTFTATSYVCITTNTNKWYHSDAYVDATAATTGQAILLEGKSEKMGVPAGEITFTLLENSDGTLTLSFAEKSASTALENAEAQKVEARKVIENGQIYIIRNGVRYNALGAQVK